MTKYIIISLLTSLLTACTSISKNAPNPNNISNIPDLTLCAYIGWRESPQGYTFEELQLEINKRNLLSPLEWQAVITRTPEVGMSRCAAHGAFGPNGYATVSTLKDLEGNLLKVSNGFKCDPSPVSTLKLPYCPFTRVDFIDGKIHRIYDGKDGKLEGSELINHDEQSQ